MAVSGSAKERWEDRTAKFNGGQWTYTRGWLVQTTDRSDRESVVSTAAGLPAYAELHPSPVSGPAYCNDIAYKPFNAPLAWVVSATYQSGNAISQNPLNEDPIVTWDGETFQEVAHQDVDGKAITNSAGDYYLDPVLTRDADHLIAHIKANVSSIPAYTLTMRNAVNDAPITIDGLSVSTGLARAKRFRRSEEKTRNGTTFYVLSYEVHIHETGWLAEPLDAGFRQRDANNKLIDIVNEGDGQKPSNAVPLNGNGKVLKNPSLDNNVFGAHVIYEEKDLTTLPGIS